MAQLRRHEDEIQALGLKVVVVTFEPAAPAQAYVRGFELRWPLLIDESRALYSAYAMGHGHWWHVFGPSAWWIYIKLLAKGRRLVRSRGNFSQLGGDVLIDPRGVVRLHHVGSGPADRPSVPWILDTIRRADSEEGGKTI